VDQNRLAGLGLDVLDIENALKVGNRETPAGRLIMDQQEISGRTLGRFRNIKEIAELPVKVGSSNGPNRTIPLGEIAEVIDGAEDERVRIRLNGTPGIKLSLQKQPQANTVTVIDAVNKKLAQLAAEGLIPTDIEIQIVDDQSLFVRRSLNNATQAALSGALLAMLVVYLFLGSLRRTLIIGSAIPIAILVTFILMTSGGLTLNIMTLGGLALGIGMLVDSTIVMLENIYRHQKLGEDRDEASRLAAHEVNSAIIASTSTNLAAVLPFLFITGLIGLLFRELILTISAAIVASMVVALTLVPALAGRIPAGREGYLRRGINRIIELLQDGYRNLLAWILKVPWLLLLIFFAGFLYPWQYFSGAKQVFLPNLDEGQIYISIKADRGISVTTMNQITERVEQMLGKQPEVATLFTTVGGSVFGRSTHESSNRASIKLQLKPPQQRGGISSRQWISKTQKKIQALQMAGVKIYMRARGIRGVSFNRSDDDFALRIKGPDLVILENLAEQLTGQLHPVMGLRNVQHSAEDKNLELAIRIDRERAASYNLDVEEIGRTIRFALQGNRVTDFITDDRAINILLKLSQDDIANPEDIEQIILFSNTSPSVPVRVSDIATLEVVPTASAIIRDRQQRIVEVSATLTGEATLEEVLRTTNPIIKSMIVPKGYSIYDAGNLETLQEGRDISHQLLWLALFLVFVVMAVQYESLRNPLIIILCVPFASIGVAAGLNITGLSFSVPVWLGAIMLAGIVVNNAIVMVEYIEIKRHQGLVLSVAIVEAARLRIRPILMTTLTTVVGMLPLALALGEGAEMLQPLAVTIVSGLLFSMLVSLFLVPCVYRLFHNRSG